MLEKMEHCLNLLDIKERGKDLKFLQILQEKYLENFVFSSINVLLNKELSLDNQLLFQRVIGNKEGGYCFEHNKIFYELLSYLGFSVKTILARVLNNKSVDVPKTHRLTLLSIEGKEYIIDVGFGGNCPHMPIPIDEPYTNSSRGYQYRVIKEQNKYFLARKDKGSFFTFYSFDLEEAFEADCEMGHFYSHKHPQANFVNNLVVSRISEAAVYSLRNGSFHIIKNEDTQVVEILSQKHLQDILKEFFSYDLDYDSCEYLFKEFCLKK